MKYVSAVVAGLFTANAYCATPVTLKPNDLEQTFWVCDYVATTRGIDYTLSDHCGNAYEQVKNTMFEGDFDRFLAWWQANKPTEHSKLQQLGR